MKLKREKDKKEKNLDGLWKATPCGKPQEQEKKEGIGFPQGLENGRPMEKDFAVLVFPTGLIPSELPFSTLSTAPAGFENGEHFNRVLTKALD